VEPGKSCGDGRVVDLAGARLLSAGHVGDLNLADERHGALDELNEITLADLRVIEVQVHPQVRAVHSLDEGERLSGPGSSRAASARRTAAPRPGRCSTTYRPR
jgi:hypothetical protein